MNNLENNKYFHDEETRKKKLIRRDKKKKNKNPGIILSFLFSMADGIERLFKASFFGYIFSFLYTKWNEKWKEGFFYKTFRRTHAGGTPRKRLLRTGFAKLYEDSLIYRIISWLSERIIHSYVRIWGVALFSFSFVMIFVAMVKYYFVADVMQENIIVGIVLAVLSLPLVITKKRLGEALVKGKLTRYIMINILSLDGARFEKNDTKYGGSYGITFIISSALGLVTYLVSPLLLIEIALVLAVFAVIMCFPELGIMAVLALIPFSNVFESPSIAIAVLIIFSLIGFFFKFIRGKRVIKFEIIDVMVLLFGAMIFFGGVFTSGTEASFNSASMYLLFISIYFLVVNSYIRKTWIYRGIKLIVLSTSVVAIVGIFEDGVISSSWVDMSVFTDIGARISSFLGNPNMLGVYLIIVFPLVLGQIVAAKKKRNKFWYGICALAIMVCAVMTWSRGAWLGIIIATLVFLTVYNFRNIWLVFAGLATLPIWVAFLPDNIVNRFLSILSMSDSSTVYRFNTWRGVVNMIGDHWLTGIGVGESAFKNTYALYAVSGTETVMHSHSLYLQILLELGIFGFIIFALVMFMYVQKCFTNVMIKNKESKSRIMISAGFAGIMGTLVMGLTDYVWYNYRVFLIFWAVMALTVALMKINEKERAKESASIVNNVKNVDLDIYC